MNVLSLMRCFAEKGRDSYSRERADEGSDSDSDTAECPVYFPVNPATSLHLYKETLLLLLFRRLQANLGGLRTDCVGALGGFAHHLGPKL